ncbi:MAG: YciI family protein [Parvibaculales bacterium]
MALYSLICWDKPNAFHIRKANRDKHLAYLKASANMKFAGPYLSEDGAEMIGSHIVLECDTREQAEDWADADPYSKAGLFARTEIHPWLHAIGKLEEK